MAAGMDCDSVEGGGGGGEKCVGARYSGDVHDVDRGTLYAEAFYLKNITIDYIADAEKQVYDNCKQ